MFVERTGYIEVDAETTSLPGVALSLEAGQELKDQTLHMLAGGNYYRARAWTKMAIRWRMWT